MRRHRKAFASIALAAAGSLFALQGANAACALKGQWNFHAIEVGPKAHAIACVLDLPANGMFSGAPCTSYQSGANGNNMVDVSGDLMLSGCDLSGSISIPGDSDVIIRSGHVNGNIGAGIATQGTGNKTQVVHFTLVKK